MSLFVDTGVWSLALRRDRPDHPAVGFLADALRRAETVFTTGLVPQEILQGYELVLLTTDRDFEHMWGHVPLRLCEVG